MAASMVVFYHFSLVGTQYSYAGSWIGSSGLGGVGEAGVDLFFVLSGFIMFYTAGQRKGGSAALRFLTKRALRIYPAYWMWTTVLLVLWMSHIALTSHAYSAGFILKSYLLIPAFSGENLHPLLNQGWTLTYELLFYILFASAMAFGFKQPRMPVVICLLCASYGAGFLFPVRSVAREILTNPLLFEFAFGMMACWICTKLYAAMTVEARHRLAWLCIFFGGVGFGGSIRYHAGDANRLLLFGVPSFCMVLGTALWKERAYHPYLVFLGDASYSIYLIHGLGVMMFATVLRRDGMLQRVPLDLLVVVGTLVLVPLCALGYLLVERPILRATRG